MFSSIAHRYDFLNRLLSLSIDQRWRRFTRKTLAAKLPADSRILDLCAGTGDLALEMARLGVTVGCDFCRPMLVRAAEKIGKRDVPNPIYLVEGDALQLPLKAGLLDLVTIAFGLRNLESPRQGMEEVFRVLTGGGRLAILEFSIPNLPVFRELYLFYFKRILPKIGALISGREGPYSYLPASVGEFAQPVELASMLKQVGFESVTSHPLTGGIATLTVAVK
jgi:demethylmenaquinone methyltransferase/2-methoxy-6-polyprenyl-1,4-benzoquinol methylase